METVRRVNAEDTGRPLDFVLSDETLCADGLIVETSGWDLARFRQNPIALFSHRSDFPIGRWENVRTEGKRLIATLKLAARGTSERIDELISLVEQGILRAVSVGFVPLEREPVDRENPGKGTRVKRSQLLETSLVAVPMNPSSLAMARSLVSDDTVAMVFGASAIDDPGGFVRRDTGASAATSPSHRNTSMEPLSKRIENAQADLTRDKDLLAAEVAKEDADDNIVAELSGRIEEKARKLEGLKRAEAALASTSTVIATDRGGVSVVPVDRGGVPAASGARPFAMPANKPKPGDHTMRAIVGIVCSHATKRSPAEIIAERYGQDGKFDEATALVLRALTRSENIPTFEAIASFRASTAPADTTTSGWASQLVETDVAAFMELLLPMSVYPGLSAKGLRLNFGRAGVISVPTRLATPTIAGSFVGQGAPIPVRQGAFSAQTLTPKKLAVITTFTREIAEHSTPAIEGLLRNAIQEDTSISLDTILLDATAASTIRPAGLRNGVSVTTATAGGGFAALVGDIKGLLGALVTASNGNLRQPVWIMNPIQKIAISLTQNAGGDFPFKGEINGNTLQGFPVIVSSTVTAGMVILVDAADFVSTEGDAPRFDTSDQATLHMEDTTPLAIGTAGSPNTVAAPVRSLWQTDSMALRMIMDCNWTMRRSGVVAWTQSVTW